MSRTEEKLCIVIAGGDVRETISIPAGAFVVCADCGYRHAKAQDIVPDAVVGDLDSWTGELPDAEIIRHPPEKDDTDTWLAVACGKEKGCREFCIYGAFGGERIDHAIANVQLLERMQAEGLRGELYYGQQRVFLWTAGETLRLRDCTMFSVFALSKRCTGVSIRGAKYALEDAVLCRQYPLGISNETAGEAVLTAESGVFLVVTTHCFPPKGGKDST